MDLIRTYQSGRYGLSRTSTRLDRHSRWRLSISVSAGALLSVGLVASCQTDPADVASDSGLAADSPDSGFSADSFAAAVDGDAAPDGDAALDGREAESGPRCKLVSGGCEDCNCEPIRGSHVDLDRACVDGPNEPLICHSTPDPGVGCGAVATQNSCLSRKLADGGLQVFQLTYTPSDLFGSDLAFCSNPLGYNVKMMQPCADAAAD